jgi:CheY-like chemotaxis protein
VTNSEIPKTVRVAIAEDEADVQAIYSLILKEAGFSVTKMFDNGHDLVEFIRRTSHSDFDPDVIITDLRMPRLDGVEAAKIIRAVKPAIKLILATAYEIPRETESLFAVVLKKPFGKRELLNAMSRCLDRSP